jgi:hypothetical protein
MRGFFLFIVSYGTLVGLGIGALTGLSILLGYFIAPF